VLSGTQLDNSGQKIDTGGHSIRPEAGDDEPPYGQCPKILLEAEIRLI
jgi:hypothetical protein